LFQTRTNCTLRIRKMESTLIQHIDATPGIRGGKPRIAGTRICVSDIVIWTEQGKSPDEIVSEYPHLTLADVYATLSFYHDHRAEIDRQIEESEAFAAALKAKLASPAGERGPDADSIPSG
jgi:uncharacterized protein (DUF433 family)